jgi:hypothetical protein
MAKQPFLCLGEFDERPFPFCAAWFAHCTN